MHGKVMSTAGRPHSSLQYSVIWLSSHTPPPPHPISPLSFVVALCLCRASIYLHLDTFGCARPSLTRQQSNYCCSTEPDSNETPGCVASLATISRCRPWPPCQSHLVLRAAFFFFFILKELLLLERHSRAETAKAEHLSCPSGRLSVYLSIL